MRSDQGGLFHKKMQGWLQGRFPRSHVTHFNAAMPAVPPSYMQHCLRLHVPQDADLIFLEAANPVETICPRLASDSPSIRPPALTRPASARPGSGRPPAPASLGQMGRYALAGRQ